MTYLQFLMCVLAFILSWFACSICSAKFFFLVERMKSSLGLLLLLGQAEMFLFKWNGFLLYSCFFAKLILFLFAFGILCQCFLSMFCRILFYVRWPCRSGFMVIFSVNSYILYSSSGNTLWVLAYLSLWVVLQQRNSFYFV